MVIDHTKIFSTEDTLEATLAKCDNFLSSFGVPASSKNWETRMMNLTSSWDSSRKQLFEAVLAFKSLPSPNCCNLCFKGKVQVRCAECPVKFQRNGQRSRSMALAKWIAASGDENGPEEHSGQMSAHARG